MIRILNENDRLSVLKYLYLESDFNIFAIGDIETYGFNEPFMQVYGEFNSENNFQSILLFYRENVIYYSHVNSFNIEYLNILDQHTFKFVSGKEELLERIYPHLFNFNKQRMYYCSIAEFDHQKDVTKDIRELTTEEEFSDLYELLIMIKEFKVQDQRKDDFISSKMKSRDMSKTVGIYENGTLVATAATTAETTRSAMVVGVATHINHRKKGYASTLINYLADHFINDLNKSLSLFYDNPEAGSIYHKIGFIDIGKWVMYHQKS